MATRGKTTQLNSMFVADFETCDAWSPQGEEIPNQKVWLAGLMNLDDMICLTFTSLEEFMKRVLARGKNVNTEIAIHNLKFDGSFIIPYLLNNGYKVTHGKPQEKEFSVLIASNNNWYSITVQVTKKRKVTFWDSFKLFPAPLKYLPDLYSTPTQKIDEGEEFYNQIRGENHKPTDREKEYLKNDLLVLAETLKEHIKLFGLQFKKTQAGQSFYNFTQHFPCWRMRFPALTEDLDEKIRTAYWGGISYASPKHAGKDCWNVGAYDINSSYPYQLATKKLPYGKPLFTREEDKHPDPSKFWVAQAIVKFKLKPNKIPCIPKMALEEYDISSKEKWVADSKGLRVLTFNCIDYLTILESYEFEVEEWCWSVHWAWKIQKEIKSFVEKNNKIKVECKEKAKTETDPEKKKNLLIQSKRAKIDNNSFYGKFGEAIEKRGYTPYLEDGDIIYREDNIEIISENKRKFLPVAMAVTAWGRRQLVQMANLLGENFIYCDTDSIHYLREEGDKIIKKAIKNKVIKVHDTELGGWKLEGVYPWGRYLRAKCYMEGDPSSKVYEVTVAGLPADKNTGHYSKVRTCCTFENFRIGLKIKGGNGKLRSIKTPTGTKLVPTDFEIKPT